MPANYTYDPTALSTSSLDRARFLLGDTGTLKDSEGGSVWLVSNEELQAMLDVYGWAGGLAQVAEALIAKYAAEPTEFRDESGVQVSWSDRFAAWKSLADRLRLGRSETTVVAGAVRGSQSTGPDTTGWPS